MLFWRLCNGMLVEKREHCELLAHGDTLIVTVRRANDAGGRATERTANSGIILEDVIRINQTGR